MQNTLDDFGTGGASVETPSREALNKITNFFGIPVPAPKEKKKEEPPSTLTQWASAGPNKFIAVGSTEGQLEPGLYHIEWDNNGNPVFCLDKNNVDGLLRFEDSQAETIMAEIAAFWGTADAFKKYHFLHRRGFLFYGPAGSGKTCLVQLIVADIIARGGLVFLGNQPNALASALRNYRMVEPERHVVCLFEDIDAIIDNEGDMAILSMLDGEHQIDHVLNIATTNYPEKLDRRLVGRPRRFDNVIHIGMPNESIRRQYFTQKFQIGDASDDLDKWVESTDEFSFAAMADLVISVKCLGQPFDSTVEKLRGLLDKNPSSSEDRGAVGFGK